MEVAAIIIFMVLGITLIVASCFAGNGKENIQNAEEVLKLLESRELPDEVVKKVEEKVSKILSEQAENAIDKAEERLAAVSNEKIIAVDEFSTQILEKIEQNHKEVVFLYDMLNEKEKDIKNGLKSINAKEKNLESVFSEADSIEKRVSLTIDKVLSAETKMKESVRNVVKEAIARELSGKDMKNVRGVNSFPNGDTKTVQRRTLKEVKMDLQRNEQMAAARRATVVENTAAAAGMIDMEDDRDDIYHEEEKTAASKGTNDQILEMYRNGKSIRDISKFLNMGQGEVKLVIGLYNK